MHAVNFRVVPLAGKVIRYRDQPYRLVGSEPYQRSDGELSVILTWQSQCPECGATFTTTSGLVTRYLTRRCPQHRKAGKPVSGKNKPNYPRRKRHG
jgi:hypothetical protein